MASCKNAVLRTGRRVDTSPPSWELRSASQALRCLRRLTFAASTNSSALSELRYRTMMFVCDKALPVVDHVNALKRKTLL